MYNYVKFPKAQGYDARSQKIIDDLYLLDYHEMPPRWLKHIGNWEYKFLKENYTFEKIDNKWKIRGKERQSR